jgi:hypothetical protein
MPIMQLDKWVHDRTASRRAKSALIGSIAITLLLYLVPGGHIIGYPLVLFATLVHELGHGLAAIACGGHFDSLQIFADASGVASHRGNLSPVADAIVSAGGLLGPAIVAALAFALGRNARAARIALGIGAGVLVLVAALFVRNAFGLAFTGLVAAGLGFIALRQPREVSQLALVFLAVQLSLSVFSSADYLFTDVAHTGAGVLPSDTAQIANALGGPYWAWGLACGAFSIAVLAAGVAWFWRVFVLSGSR